MLFFVLYHAIVRFLIRRAFADLSAGRTTRMASRFREDATFRFSGDHALGGELRGRERERIAAWFARFGRVFPNISVTPIEVVVAGGPWKTTVATRFRVSGHLADGSPYANEGMQFVRLRWGSIAEDRIYEDSARLRDALERIAQSGNGEALSESIAQLHGTSN